MAIGGRPLTHFARGGVGAGVGRVSVSNAVTRSPARRSSGLSVLGGTDNGFDIAVFGDRELERVFDILPPVIQKKLLRKSVRKGAKLVFSVVQADTPTGKTGKLKSNLKLRVTKKKRRGEISLTISTGTREEMGIDPKDPWYYPAQVHYGHRGASPNPWMRNALDKTEDAAIRLIRADVWAGIQREVRVGH